MRATLPKREKICSRKEIEELLKSGKSCFCYPFKASYLFYKEDSAPCEETLGVKIIVSVPKKNFKRAVKRNLLKRRIREAYRLNKSLFAHPSGECLNILFIYTAKEVIEYSYIEKKVIALGKKINDRTQILKEEC